MLLHLPRKIEVKWCKNSSKPAQVNMPKVISSPAYPTPNPDKLPNKTPVYLSKIYKNLSPARSTNNDLSHWWSLQPGSNKINNSAIIFTWRIWIMLTIGIWLMFHVIKLWGIIFWRIGTRLGFWSSWFRPIIYGGKELRWFRRWLLSKIIKISIRIGSLSYCCKTSMILSTRL